MSFIVLQFNEYLLNKCKFQYDIYKCYEVLLLHYCKQAPPTLVPTLLNIIIMFTTEISTGTNVISILTNVIIAAHNCYCNYNSY